MEIYDINGAAFLSDNNDPLLSLFWRGGAAENLFLIHYSLPLWPLGHSFFASLEWRRNKGISTSSPWGSHVREINSQNHVDHNGGEKDKSTRRMGWTSGC